MIVLSTTVVRSVVGLLGLVVLSYYWLYWYYHYSNLDREWKMKEGRWKMEDGSVVRALDNSIDLRLHEGLALEWH